MEIFYHRYLNYEFKLCFLTVISEANITNFHITKNLKAIDFIVSNKGRCQNSTKIDVAAKSKKDVWISTQKYMDVK